MKLKFHTLDVFTETRFAGNPLAVVLGADELIASNDVARMQAVAREFNLSETVFVGPPKNPMNSARIRIFTPASELPFAGHPTVGTAVLLARLEAPGHMQGPGGVTIALEEEVGLIRVEVTGRPDRAARAVFGLPKLPERIEWAPNIVTMARALGIDPLDIGFGAHGPSAWNAGVPYMFVPLRGLDAIGRATIADAAAWKEAFAVTGREAVYVYTRETSHPDNHVRARMFSPKLGISEDPATGSAAAAFAGPAVQFERPEDGVHQIIIEQGYEMGRPSQIVLDMDVSAGLLRGARIGGAAVMVSEGTIAL